MLLVWIKRTKWEASKLYELFLVTKLFLYEDQFKAPGPNVGHQGFYRGMFH